MSDDKRQAVLGGPVGPTLLRLAAPMVVGIASIMLFQAVDTFFVGQLGVLPLAAMTFTFPVTFVVLSVAMGLGVGTASVISRAIGTGDPAQVRRLTTDALGLSTIVVTGLGLLGLLTIDWLFPLLGAGPETVVLISEYMSPWYLAVGFLVIPMVGNGAIRATGDTRTPMLIMLVAGLVNLVLDPLLIFGWGPVPRLELRGAAIATAISWLLTFVAAMWTLHFRERMLDLSLPSWGAVVDSWRRILRIGLPAAATNLLLPLSAAILTRLISGWGEDAVAAYGVGTRIEALALVGVSALSTAATPFMGQNLGARNFSRIREALAFLSRASLVWCVATALVLALFAGSVAQMFSDHAQVADLTRHYLWMVPWSYGLLGWAVIINTILSALDSPLRSTIVMVVRLFVFVVPLAHIGAWLGGVEGIFLGIALGNIGVGAFAQWLISRHLAEFPESDPGRDVIDAGRALAAAESE